MGAREQREHLRLHLSEAILEGLEELEIIVRVGVDDLEDVADDRVSRRVEAGRVDQGGGVVEQA
ncbi:MAG: hypothetical protein IPK80_01120 [Nannocystis sp.]|nr:hypothetical protein [Nannocystis sp.]